MKLSDSSDRRGVRGEVASALETSAVAPATVPHFTRLCDLVNSSSIFVIVAHRSCFFLFVYSGRLAPADGFGGMSPKSLLVRTRLFRSHPP